MLVQETPLLSETIQSIHDTAESAEYEAQSLELQLPLNFKIMVEPFEVQTDEDYHEAD
jgi:hypothetical protein